MRRVLALASLALVGALLAGCGAGTGAVAPGHAPDLSPSRNSADSGGGAEKEITPGRSVITTGELRLAVDEPAVAASEATRLAEAAGGRVEARTEQPATDGRAASATLTLRIPAERLDAILAAIKHLGDVQSLSLNRQDVTSQVTDVDARIRALQASVDRLGELMAKASSTSDLIEIESALSQRQADLDALLSQKKYLSDQVDLSTMTLWLLQRGTAAAGGPTDFWSGVVAGWNALGTAFAGFVVALGVALPLLVIVLVLGALSWLVVWLVRRGARSTTRS